MRQNHGLWSVVYLSQNGQRLLYPLMIMKNGVINDYLIKKIKILKIKTCVYDLSVVNSKQKKMNQIVNVLILSGLGPGPSY